MIIKESIREKSFLNSLSHFVRKHWIVVGLTGLVLYSALMFVAGAHAQRTGFIRNVIQPVLKKNYKIPLNYFKAMMAKPKRIVIDIKHENFQRLAYKREVALAKKILITEADDFVPAKIRCEGQTLSVSLRLKGDWLDHLKGDKWSYRIKIKGDNTLWGMKQFSIQHPSTRRYVYEWVYHEALRREGFIALRYDFVNVVVNGKDLGIYALEEHFEKRLLEHSKYREGVILKFSEDVLWANRQQFYPLLKSINVTGLRDWLSSEIVPFKEKLTLENPVLLKQFIKGKDLLESFRLGKLPASKVFDARKMGRFFALSELLGGGHALIWANMRFYYNPVTSLLEPIGFDANAGLRMTRSIGANYYTPDESTLSLWRNLFKDDNIFTEYVKCLREFSEKTYLDKLFEDIQEGLDRNLAILTSEFPSTGFSKNVFYYNQKFIKKLLNPSRGIHPYYIRTEPGQAGEPGELVLEAGSIQTMPVEILSASIEEVKGVDPGEGGTAAAGNRFTLPIKGKVVLPGKKWLQPVSYQSLRFPFPGGFVWQDSMRMNLSVRYRLFGTSRVRSEKVYAWAHLDEDRGAGDLFRKSPGPGTFKCLEVDEANKYIYFKPGHGQVDRNLVIPAGYRVFAGEGVELDLSHSASIVSFSPLEFRGSEDAPIVITSSDSSGLGLVVMSASGESVLDHVQFRNLSNPAQEGWELTGAVTFYESQVSISNCVFEGNRSEDGLNIIRTSFKINRSFFRSTQADAFDGDFVTGEMNDVVFSTCGNDAVDISGSLVRLNRVSIDNAGDKGLSAGEGSRLTGGNIEIANSEIAVTGKDKSVVKLEGLTINQCKVGFAVFRKKPEFGSASVTVSKVKSENVRVPHLVEVGSSLTINGKTINGELKNVESRLYGVEFGKKSK